jgi:hypothetical protein
MHRWIHGGLAAIAITACRLAGQGISSIGDHETLAHRVAPVPDRRHAEPTLRDSYRLRLTSAWPQLAGADPSCINGGEEQLVGTVSRAGDDTYAGDLERRTTIQFCGEHAATAGACTLTLVGEGRVQALGHLAVEPGMAPVMQLRWTPMGGATPKLEGTCADSFGAALGRMYASVTHGLEFSLPAAASGPVDLDLTDIGWRLRVE